MPKATASFPKKYRFAYGQPPLPYGRGSFQVAYAIALSRTRNGPYEIEKSRDYAKLWQFDESRFSWAVTAGLNVRIGFVE